MPDPRILYVLNNVAFFVSHRLPLALSARDKGFHVMLATGQAGSPMMEQLAMPKLAAAGIEHKRTRFVGSGVNPLIELAGLVQLIWLTYHYRPDVVHCASPKGVLYGGIAARVMGVRALVLAVSGMGYAYTSGEGGQWLRRMVRLVYDTAARIPFGHSNLKVIVQNEEDRRAILGGRLDGDEGKLILIPGSGVDLACYTHCSAVSKQHCVLLPARMLTDKGIREFVEAARVIRQEEPSWRFILAGAADHDNPSAISVDDLKRWQAEGIVEWLGHIDEMLPYYEAAAIVCLPSYREGMPKALLEAAAAACAVVTTDVTGCKEAIVDGETGDLVAARDAAELTRTLLALIRDTPRRQRYGANGQKLASSRFSVDSVVENTLRIYGELLAS